MHERTSPDLVDMVVLSSSRIPSVARRLYADHEAQPVKNGRHRLEGMGVHVIQEDLTATDRTIRHDPYRLARLLVRLAGQFAEPLGTWQLVLLGAVDMALNSESPSCLSPYPKKIG